MLLAAAWLAACSKQQSHRPDDPGSGGMTGGSGAGGAATVVDTTAVSGSRLRAQYLTTTDGTRQFQGWFDQSLKFSCHFSAAEDGQTRCLPDAATPLAGAFSDANCMQPLVQADVSCSDTPAFASKSSSGDCGPTAQIFAVGAAQTPTQIYYASGTSCVPGSPPANQKFYALGAKIDPSMFIAGASAGVPSGHRLDPVYTLGSDGSKQRTGWFDTVQKSACTIGIAADQKSRCLPTPSAIVLDTFSDAGCTLPLAESVANAKCDTAGAPSLAFKIDTSACPAAKHLYAVTAPFQGTQVYAKQAGACTATPVGSTTFYQVTEVNPPEFDLFLDTQPGSGRLHAEALLDADGATEFESRLFDTQRGESCSFTKAADGQTRCLPDGAGVLFNDAQCMQSIAVATPSCGSSAPDYARLSQGGSCGSGVSIHALGDKTSATALYSPGSDGKCASTAAPSATLYGVGAEVAASEFVAATISTE